VSTEIDQPDELATHAAEVAAPDVIAGSLGEYVRSKR